LFFLQSVANTAQCVSPKTFAFREHAYIVFASVYSIKMSLKSLKG